MWTAKQQANSGFRKGNKIGLGKKHSEKTKIKISKTRLKKYSSELPITITKRDNPKAYKAEFSRLSRLKYPNKYKKRDSVYRIVRFELKTNRLKRPKKCNRCGKKRILQGHHPNYNKPLKILWLCYKCHYQIHAKIDSEE